MNGRTKTKLRVIIFVIILLAYVIGFGVIFNLKDVLGIAHYSIERNYLVDVDGEQGGLNVKIHANHNYDTYHEYYLSITPFAKGNLGLEGISYLFFRFDARSTLLKLTDINYTTPIRSYYIDGESRFSQNTNVTCKGFADVIFKQNNNNQTIRIFMDLGVIITLDGPSVTFEWGNVALGLNTIYLSFTAVPLTLLYRNIKRLKFEKWYSDEIKERDDRFLKILSKRENVHQE